MAMTSFIVACAAMTVVLLLSHVDSAPVIDRPTARSCGDNAMSSHHHCVCQTGFQCIGSRCSHAIARKLGVGNLFELPQGFPIAGPHECSDCKCIPHSQEAKSEDDIAPAKKMRMFAGIKSGTAEKYKARREQWRNSGCPEQYAKANIGYKFFIGIPVDNGHLLSQPDPAAHDTEHERHLEHILEEEATEKGDLELVPMRDMYMDLTNKLLQLFRYGYYETNADYIIEHDDEYCMRTDVALQLIEDHEKNKPDHELYAGNYHWRGDEYAIMKGADGSITPFMSGWCSFLSRKLMGYILERDWAHTVMAGPYGTSSDDANTGRWVNHMVKAHGVKVDLIGRDMVQDTSKMKKNR
eukprot:m.181352 g.181352  ORF g.181352 m.181352 type:complete len:353 (-) comp15238_c0_seq1:116-1174(-)